ncbi:MAG: fatty acyl-AMP ligase [Acetobacter sp.]|nr:fatty acyl-AMP ligase [Acetobacter sp.]
MSTTLTSSTEAFLQPTLSNSGQPRRYGDFATFTEALDYAAQGAAGFNIYSGKGVLLESLPYGILRTQALETARRLLGTGLQPGDRVTLIAENDGDFARIFFACQYAGLIVAPLPLPMAFGSKKAYLAIVRGMIETAQARAVIIPAVIEAWTEEIVNGLDLVFFGSPKELLDLPTPNITLPAIQAESLSYIQFSSGSTRVPMGVCVTHRSGMANVAAIARDGLRVKETGDRCVSWLPFYHDMGLVGFFLTPMTCQLTVDLMSTREFARRPHVWLELISRNRGTLAYAPPFGYELCTRRPASPDLDLSCWRVAGIGGDMIRPRILTDFAQHFRDVGFNPKAFVASYGMAEATLAISFAPLNCGIKTDIVDLPYMEQHNIARAPQTPDTAHRTFALCGVVLPHHELEVRALDGTRLQDYHIGTIYVRGPSLMSGYFHREEETRRVLDHDGWLNTGDLGYTCDNQIVVTGRAKDLIIINGRNIWPQDLEWSLEAHIPGLRSHDVAVFSVETEENETIVALIQCRLSEQALREKLRAEAVGLFHRLHGVDVSVVLAPPHTLPRTSSGKLIRSKARSLYLEGIFSQE